MNNRNTTPKKLKEVELIKKIELDTPLKALELKNSEENLTLDETYATIKINAETLKNLSNGWGGDKQSYRFSDKDYGLEALNTNKGFQMTIQNTTIADLDELEVIKKATIEMGNLKQNIMKVYLGLLVLVSRHPSQFMQDCTLNFDTYQLAEVLGRKDTDDFRRELLRYFKVINFTTISVKKGQIALQIGGGYYSVSRRTGKASFQFQNKFFSTMLNAGFVTAIPYQVLQTDASRNPTAFRIGLDFVLQKRLNIGTKGTAKNKRQNSVAVKTLYNDLLNTKEIEAYNPKTGKFKSRFRPNFEKGLNYYKGIMFKNWRYKDTQRIDTFDDWIKNTIIVEYTSEMEEILTQKILEGQRLYFEKENAKKEKATTKATAKLLRQGDKETTETLREIIKTETEKQIKPHVKSVKRIKKQIENQAELFEDYLHGTSE